MHVDRVGFDEAVQTISGWAEETGAAQNGGAARMVCAANVHMVMEARDDPAFQAQVNAADLVVADGQPLVWAMRLQGVPQHGRVRVSPDLILQLLAEAERRGCSLGLYGGNAETLPVVLESLAQRFPKLRVPYAWAPPFRPLTPEEDENALQRINASNVQLLLVGLGCPKQERWMAEHKGRLDCVVIGVGAAFDLLGGRTKEAPRWTHNIGLEWAFRLAQEPRRLWQRHLKNDPRFVALLAAETFRQRRTGAR